MVARNIGILSHLRIVRLLGTGPCLICEVKRIQMREEEVGGEEEWRFQDKSFDVSGLKLCWLSAACATRHLRAEPRSAVPRVPYV
jgi:hypothetical protein